MREVNVTIVTKVIMLLTDDINVEDVISDMYYDFSPNTDGVRIVDTDLVDYTVVESK